MSGSCCAGAARGLTCRVESLQVFEDFKVCFCRSCTQHIASQSEGLDAMQCRVTLWLELWGIKLTEEGVPRTSMATAPSESSSPV